MAGESSPARQKGILPGSPLLATKLYVPPTRTNLVPRPRLLERLDQALTSRLILISAPAGFGKTMLLSEWISQRQGDKETGRQGDKEKEPQFSLSPPPLVSPSPCLPLSFAWLSLDAGDNDPLRFLSYVIAALQTIAPGVGAAAQEMLCPPQLPPAESILTALVNDLCSLASNVVLVLDDYHAISASAIHSAIAFLLDHLPPQVHVVIATRADPHLPLARWRSRGQSVEIRAEDLRFTTDEAAAFLNLVMGLNLSAEDVATLEARTEGWIAGLQMAALSMRGRQDISRFIQSFSGSHRYVLDYLAEEVLNRQPEHVQTFLLQTSILERLCGPLCDAVRDQGLVIRDQETALSPDHRSLITNHRSPIPDSQSILEYLDHANLFIVPLDSRREWYRYHRLLSDLLRKRLGQAQPNLIPTLHRRASDWYERQGHLEEAVEHAFSALDYPRAARLVEEVAEAVLMRSEVATLQRWLDRLPDADLTTRPTLCVYHAWTLLQSNHPLEVIEARLDRVAPEDEHSSSQAAVLRAYIAVYQGRLSRAAALARQALEHLTHQDAFLRSLGLIVLATCELADGSPEAGYQALEQAARIGERPGNVMASVIVLANLAENHQKEGRLHKSEALCRRALDLAVDAQGNRLPIAGWPLIVLGELMRERNQLESAARCLEEGIELIHQWGVIAAYPGYIALARLRQAQGDIASALAALEEARRIALSTDVTEIDDYVVAVAQASFSIDQGDLEAATQWAQRRELLRDVNEARLSESEQYLYAHLRKYEQTVLARLWLAQGRTDEALQLLDGLLPKVEKARRIGMAIEVQGLRAMALHALGSDGGALLALENALALAEPEGYVRIFVDQGAPMAALLRKAADRGIAPGYVSTLLAALAAREGAGRRDQGPGTRDQGLGPSIQSPISNLQLLEPLSEREVEVLRLLRSSLTVPEIAGELYVAESTIRSHVKSIYGKLGVHRRMDAIQRAQMLGLLSGSEK